MPDASPIATRLALARRPAVDFSPWQRHYRRDVAALLEINAALCERLYTMSRHLSVLAERKERRRE